MRAVIFGISGQDGYYLSKLLIQKGIEVIGVSRKDRESIDIQNYQAVEDYIKKIRPDYIFHLAAISKTAHENILENHTTIVTGTLNILESVYRSSLGTKVFVSGSGLQFENKNIPIKEKDQYCTDNAYSLARVESAMIARYYKSRGVKAYIGYFYNHDSPKRSKEHMTMKIFDFAKNAFGGSKDKLEIGDIHAKKEYGYAGDIVEGIWTLVNQSTIFEANISVGKAYSIEDWLEICFNYYQLNWRDYVVVNKKYISPYKVLVSDNSVMKSLGWLPKHDIEDLHKLFIDECK